MQYADLHDLISKSSSCRRYFLSQSVSMQMELHKYNNYIHNASQLRLFASKIESYNHAIMLSEMLFKE